MTRLLLVDDHASSRELLALMIASEPGVTDVLQASSLAEAADLLDQTDVAVIDLGLPDGDGLTLVHDLRRRRPVASVLVLTASFDPRSTERAISAGAAAVLNKTISLDELRAALRRVGVGTAAESGVDRRPSLKTPEPARHPAGRWRLSPREQDVLEALADGLTDKEIGHRQGISIETVRTHMAGLFGKLGVESRLQALAYAVRWGLVQPEPTQHPPGREPRRRPAPCSRVRVMLWIGRNCPRRDRGRPGNRRPRRRRRGCFVHGPPCYRQRGAPARGSPEARGR